MSLAEWMKLVAESAKDLPDDVHERIANRSMEQTTNNLTNTDLDFAYEDFEYSRTTPEIKTYTIEWRYTDDETSKEKQRAQVVPNSF